MGEIHALNSKIQVIAQRMKIIERNEEIIGKTLIGHNKMLKGLEDEVSKLKTAGVSVSPSQGPDAGEMDSSLGEMRDLAQQSKKLMDKNKKDIDLIKAELNEIKYVLDTINPVAYVTIDQAVDLIEEKIEEYMKKKRI